MRFTHSVCTTGLFLALALSGCSSDSDRSSSTPPGTTNPGATQGGGTTTQQGATVQVSSMAVPRGCHTATATPNGVVVMGGEDRGQVLASVEVYQNGTWSPKGHMSSPRKGHSATALQNGRVLVVGGQADATGSLLLTSCEVYDPITGTFAPAGALNQPRTDHVAIAFTYQGREMVLVAGGVGANGSSLATAEVYDVATNRFSPIAAMNSDRANAKATVLPNGKILIAGGVRGFSLANPNPQPAPYAEIFDPALLGFSSTPNLGIARYGAALALTDQGAALFVGGNSGAQPEAGVESYDPATNAWTASAAKLSQAREELSLTAVSGGNLLAVGGMAKAPSAAVELYDSASDRFTQLSGLQVARQCHTATHLSNGTVLIVGGYDAKGALATAEEYDPFAPAGTTPRPVPTTVVPPIGPPSVGPPVQQNPPKILAVLPGKGKPGDLITIAGQEFAPNKADNQVWFMGGVQGKVMFEIKVKKLPFLGAVQTLIVEVPQGAQSGDLTVVSRGRQSSGKNFTIDMQSGPEPKILRTLQSKAAPNSMITVFGRNFARPAGNNTVRFAGVPGAVVGGISTQSIPFLGSVSVMLVVVPPGAVTGDLTVEANGRVSNGYRFEVIGTTPAPGGTVPGAPAPGTPSVPGAPAPPALTTLYAENFEGTSVNMGGNGIWEVRVPAMPGPVAAASGQWCSGTSMAAGQYPANSGGLLYTPEIDLSGRTTAELRFNQWFDTDGVDAGRVIISVDRGQTWGLLRPQGGYATTTVFQAGEGFVGQSGGWLLTTCDLSAFAGQRVVIAFEFLADGANERAGWYLDDIEVRGN